MYDHDYNLKRTDWLVVNSTHGWAGGDILEKQNFLAARLKRRYAAFAHIKTKHSNNNKKHCYKGAHSSREGETERLSLAKISNKKTLRV